MRENPPSQAMNNHLPRRKLTTTNIHLMAFDGIINVNSLFTIALFLGLAFNPADPTYTLVGATTCASSSAVPQHLVSFQIYSFSSFLFSSLVASALKQAIRTSGDDSDDQICGGVHAAQVSTAAMRAGILASAAGSACGCVFLTVALVDLIEIKLGRLSCWSWDSLVAVGSLVTLVPSGLVIYICIVLHAFAR